MASPGPPERSDRAPGTGSVVGHYRILAQIGRGGMGVVFRALDLNLEREVALKCPRPDLTGDKTVMQRFMREARTVSKLSHPCIVPVFEVFEHDGHPWLASELVDGDDLRAVIEHRGPLPPDEVIVHAEGLAAALDAAHAKNVLHRDIKPGNVLIGKDGRARLSDFGLARVFASGSGESVTQSDSLTKNGHVVGTPGYMSPEQVLGKTLDVRSDIFALGAVLYEMCAGRPAFASPEQGGWVDAVLHLDPPAISRFNYDTPQELERIVRKAVAKRPDERYQHASEMLADLRALRRRVESEDHAAVERTGIRRWRAWAIPVLIAAGFAVVGLGGGLWMRARKLPPLPSAEPRQLTSSPGAKGDPALSPDDSFVAYQSDETGNPEIWLMDLKSRVPLRLTNDPGSDTSPAWLPDSSGLLFASDRSGSLSIYKIPRLGGEPILLLPDAMNPSISPDGAKVAFARPDAAGQFRIGVAPLGDPGRATILTGRNDGLWDHLHPAWSPDGTTICYEDFRDLWVVPAAGGKPSRLTNDHAWNLEPAWSPDGRAIYFSSYREGTHALWRIPASGGKPGRITSGMGPEGHPSVTRSGSRLAYTTYVSEFTLTILDLHSGRRTRLPSLLRANGPAFSPDDAKLYFLSDRLGRSDLWVQALRDGTPQGEPARLTEQPGHIGTFAVSPDGRWIAYHGNFEGRRDIWTVHSTGGPPTRITVGGVNAHPSWSPDGKRLAFVSDRDGSTQVWTVPVQNGQATGPAVRLTSGVMTVAFPCWSPDGSSVAFVGGTAAFSEVFIVPASGRSETRRMTTGAEARMVRWDSSSGDLLIAGAWGAGRTELRRLGSSGGEAVPLTPPVVFGDASAVADFQVSRDGALVVYDREDVRGEIWVLEANRGSF